MSNSTINSYSQTLYQAFRFNKNNKKNNPIDYVRNSKQLILNSQSYKSYSDYYDQVTTIYSFKLPDLNQYPVRKNKCLISLKKLDSSLNWKKKRREEAKEPTVYQTTEATKKEESIVVTEGAIENFHKHASGNINEHSLLRFIDDFNNINILYQYISYKEKYSLPVDRMDFSYLDKSLQELEWRAEMLDKPSSIVNAFSILNNSYKVTLKCSSLTVLFNKREGGVNNKVNDEVKEQEIALPFELLPFFYGLSYSDVKFFLSLIIAYDNDKEAFTLNRFSFEHTYLLFKDSKDFYGSDCLFLNLNKAKQTLQFDYPWITPSAVYTFTVKLPHYKFQIDTTELNHSSEILSIERAISTRYIIHFLKTAFKDWDLFLMNCLSEYKEFRLSINQSLSFNPSKTVQPKIVLGKTSIKSIDDLSDSVWELFYTNQHNFSAYMRLNSTKVQFTFPETNFRDSQSFKFNLTMNQTRLLYLASQQFSIEEILARCFNVKNGSKGAVKEELKAELSLNCLEDFDKVIHIKSNSNETYSATSKDKGYEMTIIQPYIDWECNSVSNSLSKKVYLLPKEEALTLMSFPIREWVKLISNQLPLAETEAFRIELKEDLFSTGKTQFRVKEKKVSSIRLKTTRLSSSLIMPKIERQKTNK